MNKIKLRSASILTMLLCWCGHAWAANTVYVSPTGSDFHSGASTGAPVQTIAHALTEVSAGDTIQLADGTYSLGGDSNLTINIPITITSKDGPGSTFIDPPAGNSGITCTAGTSSAPITISGITIENTTDTNRSLPNPIILNTAYVQINDCHFATNTNAAVTVDDQSRCSVNACEFAYSFSSAINSLGYLNVTNSVFNRNSAAYGGAIYSSGPLQVFNSQFTGNSATTGGGAICVSNSTATISGSTFDGNKSQADGGALYSTGTVTVSYSLFDHNAAGLSSNCGAAIDNAQGASQMTLINDIFSHNDCYTGGAVCNFTTLTADYCTMTQNTAFGGGVYNEASGTCSLDDDIMWDNAGIDAVNYNGSMTTFHSDFSSVSGFTPYSNDIDTDPQFVDSANNDYSLRATSPCRGVGGVIASIPTDFKGRPRNKTATTLGAIEGGQGGEFQYTTSASGPDGVDREIWNGISDDAGYFALWRVVPPASPTTTYKFGPFNYGKPLFIGVGPNLHERVLFFDQSTWKVTLFDIAPNLSETTLSMGPYTNFTPTSMSVSTDNHVHIVFSATSGTVANYDVSTDGTHTSKTYGPY